MQIKPIRCRLTIQIVDNAEYVNEAAAFKRVLILKIVIIKKGVGL